MNNKSKIAQRGFDNVAINCRPNVNRPIAR